MVLFHKFSTVKNVFFSHGGIRTLCVSKMIGALNRSAIITYYFQCLVRDDRRLYGAGERGRLSAYCGANRSV